ncbi:hypothetical protein L593_02030 [Salinarchaeum sp. Harcht-Bsk1]|uniref:hypothetical protein n=1 Tax=Salinarchaeum sp. Harcht-Bsk1 TaxID=1333523 RepID=UPI000342443B|nr:hypothetical protein [Salinarchaeum sp. Harcht-Bsk1]AGN00357.1 hypothetical protein L593_02030 [Salinarchaeum sp. Harcht-Bsk1]
MRTLRLNPYADVDWDAVERHKAQLHAHTAHPPTNGHSGRDPPETVIDDYADAGYSVLALTGHEYAIDEPTWPWTDWDRSPEDLGMVAIRGAELGGSEEGLDRDLLSYFSGLADTSGMTVADALQEIGDREGLAVFPHPGRYPETAEWYVEHFLANPHLLGVEVVNAADRYPTDRDVWDALQELLGNERPVWGFANDDYHGRDAGYTFDGSRNVCYLEELTEASVREALVEGRFVYQHVEVDAPPILDSVEHDPDRGVLSVAARGWEEIQWASDGAVVERGPALHYRDVDGVGEYVRARLVAPGGSETGTQPFLLE